MIALRVALHGLEALKDILVRASPGMVDAHGVIGRNRTVNERPARIVFVLCDELVEGSGILPKLEDPMLHAGKVEVSADVLEPGQFVPPR